MMLQFIEFACMYALSGIFYLFAIDKPYKLVDGGSVAKYLDSSGVAASMPC